MPNKLPKKISEEISDEFVVRDNTFIKDKVTDVARRIEIEIGDEKEPTRFLPQFKTKHWDNECNFSVRLKDDDYDTGVIKTELEKVIWEKGNVSARLYEKDTDDEDGGFEFDILFKAKPVSNVVEFSIQTKGLKFLYQPALSQEKIDAGHERPDNVIGSYAVYHKTKQNNKTGGKAYRVGKAFHIYRPYAEDANGVRVWCELQLDEVAGELNVVVPQQFLDDAVYPVLVDPTFGYTSVGGTGASQNTNDFNGSHFDTTEAGTVTSFECWDAVGGYGRAIITDDSGYILTDGVGAKGTPFDEYSAHWATSLCDDAEVDASTTYWLGWIGGNFSQSVYDTETDKGMFDGTNDYTTPTDPTDATLDVDEKVSIYAVYTAAAAGDTLTKSLTYKVTDTPTAKTKSLTYEVTATISSLTKSLKYTVISTPTAPTKSLKYTVILTPTAPTKSLTYAVLTTPTAPTKSLTYYVTSTPSTVTKSLTYEVTASVTIQKSLQYLVIAAVSAITKSLKYTIITTPTTLTKSLTYFVVITPTAPTKSLDYSVTSTPSAKTKSLQYVVLATVAAITKSLTYEVTTKNYTREANASLPTDNADLATQYSLTEVSDVSADDGTRVALVAGNDEYALRQYKLNLPSNTETIYVKWNGQSDVAPSISSVLLQIYNYNSAAWETLDTDSASAADADFTLEGTQSANLANYHGTNDEVSVRVYQREPV